MPVSGNVQVVTYGGSILNNNTVYTTNITGNKLTMAAYNGIGDDGITVTPIDTVVNELAARVTNNLSSQGIYVDNAANLALDDIQSWGYAVENFGSGKIDIEVAELGTQNLTVNANVISNGGSIYLSADGDIDQSTGTTINSNGGEITLQADSNSGGVGGITQTGTAEILSGGGDINLYSGIADGGSDISLTYVDAGSGNVQVITYSGAILNNNTFYTTNIIGNQLIMSAADGIGTTSIGGEIETQVAQLDAVNTSSNDIVIHNTGALELIDLNSDTYSVSEPGDCRTDNYISFQPHYCNQRHLVQWWKHISYCKQFRRLHRCKCRY